jgi:Mn-dependent DtxR family transcriptional regulator
MTPRQRLYHELLRRAQEQVGRALRVALLIEAGVPRAEIAQRLEVEPKSVALAVKDLQAIAEDLLREDERPQL